MCGLVGKQLGHDSVLLLTPGAVREHEPELMLLWLGGTGNMQIVKHGLWMITTGGDDAWRLWSRTLSVFLW